jgi:hypothetical protein
VPWKRIYTTIRSKVRARPSCRSVVVVVVVVLILLILFILFLVLSTIDHINPLRDWFCLSICCGPTILHSLPSHILTPWWQPSFSL